MRADRCGRQDRADPCCHEVVLYSKKSYLAVGKLDIALYRKLAALLEFMATDAASSELLSVRMMQRGVKLDGLDATAPNLRHTRDKVYGEQKQMQANTNTQRKLTLSKLAC